MDTLGRTATHATRTLGATLSSLPPLAATTGAGASARFGGTGVGAGAGLDGTLSSTAFELKPEAGSLPYSVQRARTLSRLSNVEIARLLRRENPALRRTDVLRRNSGRYSAEAEVPTRAAVRVRGCWWEWLDGVRLQPPLHRRSQNYTA